MAQITVLVADAQPLFVGALSAALSKFPNFFLVPERATSWPEAFQGMKLRRPDVALLDFWLPETPASRAKVEPMDRQSVLDHAAQTVPGCKILITSLSHGPDEIRRALNAGAVGFLPKSLGVAEVAEAVRRAHKGDPLVFAEELHDLYERVGEKARRSAETMNLIQALTAQEFQVLVLLAEGRARGEIAEELFLSRAAVSARIHKILTKMGVRTSAEALAMARRAGLLQN